MAYETGLLNLPADRPWMTRMVAAGLGVLTTLAFEPAGLSLLAPLLILPLLYITFVVSPRDAGWVFFCYGVGLFISGTYWIHISVTGFGGAPWWVAVILMIGLVLLMSFWMFFAGYLTSRLSHGEPWLLLLMAPASWVVIEWLRSWMFTGFPWMALGYSQIDSAFAGWAPVLGVYGVTFALVFSTTAILVAVLTAPPGRWIAVGLVVAPWILGVALGAIDWTEANGPPVRSTLIQGGVSQDKKWLPEQRQPTLDFYRSATRDVPDSEIVVWPEVAVPAVIDQVEEYVEELQGTSRSNKQTILFGVLERVAERGEVDIYNSVVALDGQSRQIYRKRHLVPYGEYTPLLPQFVLEWLQTMNIPYPTMTPGQDEQLLLRTTGGLQLATAICYEDAYPAEMRYALPDASIIINVSNDAWFGDSIAAHQHMEIARMRSLEFGRPTIRATNTGISAFIDHNGEVIKDGPQFLPVSLTASIQPQKGVTPYANGGNLPILLLCAAFLGFGWIRIQT